MSEYSDANDTDVEHVTVDEAKQLIEDYQFGRIVLCRVYPKPSIGDVESGREFVSEVRTVAFGRQPSESSLDMKDVNHDD